MSPVCHLVKILRDSRCTLQCMVTVHVHVSGTEPLITSFVVPPASSENMVHSRHVIHVEVSGGKVLVLPHHCSGCGFPWVMLSSKNGV